MYMPTARKPTKRFCIFLRRAIWVGGWGRCNNVQCVCGLCTHFMLRCARLLYFGGYTSRQAAQVFCTSLHPLPVSLHTSSVLRWMHFMLCCTRLLYSGGSTSCYAAHVFCTLRIHFMLRCTRLLYFGGCVSSYARPVFCTSVDALHHTPDPSSVLRWMHFIIR